MAHQRGMYVILDVVHNHTGNNWYYEGLEGVQNLKKLVYYREEGLPLWRLEDQRRKGL